MITPFPLKGQVLKTYLLKIIEKIDDKTTVEDIFKQIALLEDIYTSEQQIAQGEGIPQEVLEKRSQLWIKFE
ncbi:MAG: hypothetical protein AAF587_02275 [Bacteroidota bacterium]